MSAYDHIMDVVGVMQHHDAATGTSGNDVAADYADMMYSAQTHVYEAYQ